MASRNLADADPGLARAFRVVTAEYEAAHPGQKVIVTCTARSVEEQWADFIVARHQDATGQWVADDPVHHRGIVTNADGLDTRSEHNQQPARAIDFAILIHGRIRWDVLGEYEAFGAAAVTAGLEYGGNWVHFQDWCHVQLPPPPRAP